MINLKRNSLSGLEAMVHDGHKPGAFSRKWRKKGNDERVLLRHGIESGATKNGALAIAKPELALPVVEDFVLTERLHGYSGQINDLADEIEALTIMNALVLLNDRPRKDTTVNAEDPEVAIIEGALLGYSNCCVDYYTETRYEDPTDIMTRFMYESVTRNLPITPDNHVLCGSCAVEFAITK